MATKATISAALLDRSGAAQLDNEANIPLARRGDASGSWRLREGLAEIPRTAHIRRMIDRATWKRWLTHPVVDWTVFIVGVVLILLAPVVGALPGPGGVFVLALGLAMVLRTSRWARRRYVAFKRWQPKAGRWTDWGMRRKSALRREKIRKDREEIGEPPPTGPLDGRIPAPIPVPPANSSEGVFQAGQPDRPGN